MIVRQLRLSSEERQPTSITPYIRHDGSRSECPINAQGSGMRAYVLFALNGAAYRLVGLCLLQTLRLSAGAL
jgi:hypothetical protein